MQCLDHVRDQIAVRVLGVALLLDVGRQIGQGAQDVVDDGSHDIAVGVGGGDRGHEHVADGLGVRQHLVGGHVGDDVEREGAHLEKRARIMEEVRGP